jgi:hypothetical protein
LRFWANSDDDGRLARSRAERRNRLFWMRCRRLVAKGDDERTALTQQIRVVKAHYKEAIRKELHKIHLDASQSVTRTGSTSRRLNDKRRD